jgi:hypothetical protein
MLILSLFVVSGSRTVDNNSEVKVAEINSSNWGLVGGDFLEGEYFTLYSDGLCKYYKMYKESGIKDEKTFTI